jgi:uncharacterized membrane protein YjgN (DUF898 family)
MGSVLQHPPPLPPAPVSFYGDRDQFRWLVTRGARLELITFGFYRFWLATDIRRHLWSNTDIDGDAAEYTGRAKELLIGFLFALAILVPIYLSYFLIGLEAERNQQLSSSPLLVLFYAFGQFAIYRARRYRLTRTVWRGVRFWMDGSAVAYAGRAAFWSLLTVLTLGLALPWRAAALERYKMRHSYYGDLPGDFDGRGWVFFKRAWWIWLLTIVTSVVLLLIVPLAKWFPVFFMPVAKIVSGSALLIPVAAPFLYGLFKAIEWRWWLSGVRFGEVWLESSLSRTALIGLYWKVFGWLLLLMILFTGYMAGCMALIASVNQTPMAKLLVPGNLQANIPLVAVMAVGYLALILAMNVVIRMYLLRDVWVRVVSSVTVHNIEAAANVSAEGELANALGEGFADALDVAGF